MWLSKQTRPALPTADADLGVTSISGGQAGVITRGETRELPVYGPGGYIWQPAAGQTVLVIRGGPGGEESCVAAAKQPAAPEGMQPGEICLRTEGGSIYLKNNGTVEIRGQELRLIGTVKVEGSLYINGEPYRPCYC